MAGHIRRRGKNSWAIVLDIGTNSDGTRQQRWHSVKGTRKDAERERTKLLNQLDTGSYIEPTRITLGEYLRRWLSDAAKQNVSAKTFERYNEIVDLHLLPALGHIPLAKLSPLHVQGYYAKALESGRIDGKGGLSPQTVLHFHRVLHQALNQAVRWQLVVRNVTDAVEPPRPVRVEMSVINDAQTVAMLDSARETRFYLPLLLAVTTGMRRGEILALRWADIDFDAKTISVRRSLEQTRATGVIFKAPKTQKSRRVIALPQETLIALKDAKVRQARERLSLGAGHDNRDLVVCKLTGEPWRPDSFASEVRTYLTGIGVCVRFHDLRHTHATTLLRQGINAKVVSERLGHSTVGMTLDVYSHVLPDMQSEAAERMDAALSAARFSREQ